MNHLRKLTIAFSIVVLFYAKNNYAQITYELY